MPAVPASTVSAPAIVDPALEEARRDAVEVCNGLVETMDALIMVVEEETALVKAGNLEAAYEVEIRKSRHARRYLDWLDVFQAVGPTLRELAPDGVEHIRRQHEVFRATLQISLAVLATARETLEPRLAAE